MAKRALEQFDLAGALRHTARQIMEASDIQIDVVAVGRVRPLPERIEDNLLRMTQEALTNVIKHAAATKALVELDFGVKNISLLIQDNGKGFNPNDCSSAQDGHFGLLGMSERTKRLGGTLSITSSAGVGTTIRITIPLESKKELNYSTETSPPDKSDASDTDIIQDVSLNVTKHGARL